MSTGRELAGDKVPTTCPAVFLLICSLTTQTALSEVPWTPAHGAEAGNERIGLAERVGQARFQGPLWDHLCHLLPRLKAGREVVLLQRLAALRARSQEH